MTSDDEALAAWEKMGVMVPLGSFQDFFSRALTGNDDTVSKAVEEKRCIGAPLGCGEPLLKEDGTPRFDHFPNRETAELYEREWRITGMCPNCQDRLETEAEKYENEDAAHNVPDDERPF